jgi:tRNA(His) 5'-end guanylyltransferase
MNKDSLGDRMKQYENVTRLYLTKRMPLIIRIDGKAFHSFTKGFQRPFDEVLIKTMQETAKYLCENIEGCKLAYTQSDEISLLLTDYDQIETQPWFDKNLLKIVSIGASMATLAFNSLFQKNIAISEEDEGIDLLSFNTEDNEKTNLYHSYWKSSYKGALFDARAFVLPREEVCNYFIWRQNDCTRNSIQMVAQSCFSHKELQGKSCNELQNMLLTKKDINWNNFSVPEKRGSCCTKTQIETILDSRTGQEKNRLKWCIDYNIPIFKENREYIESLI